MIQNINPSKEYKTKVTYGEKTIKKMCLTGEQIIKRNKINSKNKHESYIKIEVIQEV